MSFGKNLKRLRIERNLSQADIAQAVGVYQSMISAVETGERRPSLQLAFSIASFLGVTLDELNREHEPAVPTAADPA